MKYYTGIGSRETPPTILWFMEEISFRLCKKGYHLRTGGATGADSAFIKGVEIDNNNPKMTIYIPRSPFNGHYSIDPAVTVIGECPIAEEEAQKVHPAWGNCNYFTRLLHTRNVYQVLGDDLQTPSRCVICYAEPIANTKRFEGGINTALQIAMNHNIPIFNFYFEEDIEWIKRKLRIK